MALHINYHIFCLLVLRKLTVHGFQEPQQNMEVMVSLRILLRLPYNSLISLKGIFSVGVFGLKITPVTPCKIWMAMMIESALSLVLVQRVNSSV